MSITGAEFQFIADLTEKEAAIVLKPGKEYLVETRLMPIIEAAGLVGFSDLVSLLKDPKNRDLKVKTVEALTTNETSFFRDAEPFEILRKEVLPQLVDARRQRKALRIWSAASSTGQELYSIAMMIEEHFPEVRNWTLDLHGTDLSSAVVQQATNGRYSQLEINRGLPATSLVKFFEQTEDGWQVKESLRKKVQFREFNLLNSFASLGQYDVIFIRNVLIYFEPQVKQSILDKCLGALAPDGALFLGTAESTLGLNIPLSRHVCGRTSYYRKQPTNPTNEAASL